MPPAETPATLSFDGPAAAKQQLAEGLEELRRLHQDGCPGTSLCTMAADLRDELLRGLFSAAMRDVAGPTAGNLLDRIALVAHGGYGRRDVAPYSDVDLMILHAPAVRAQVAPLAERMLRDVFDAGLVLGHSVRTPDEASQLAAGDPVIATSLMESRLLAGSQDVFSQFVRALRRQVRRKGQKLMEDIIKARAEERTRYGETAYLLEPNVKRSGGTLRDLQLLRWIGFMRYGAPEPRELLSLEVLSKEDVEAVEQAAEFLLRLRNEMHFHAGKPADVLDRFEQVRVAERFGYRPAAGMLAVERFMQDCFRHTGRISHVARRLVARARSKDRLARVVTAVFGHQADEHLYVGPAGVLATQQGLQRVRGNLTAAIRMADLANLYDKPIVPETWEAIRREGPWLPEHPSTEACRHFRSLLSHPARLGTLLRDLHEAGVLERFVPVMAHARGLLQFNQYHKYTVDEHCLRTVDFATKLLFDMGPLGRAYRQVARKHVLHLALLVHDLGKGFAGDHCEVGARLARQMAERLRLAKGEADDLEFLVHRHLLMNHSAFRRDTKDRQLVARFAREVGSPELLRMLFVMTAADLAAAAPGTWDGWKAEIVTDLFVRTMQQLTASSPTETEEQLQQRRDAVRAELGSRREQPWLAQQIDALPSEYLGMTEPRQVAADLRLLRELGTSDSRCSLREQNAGSRSEPRLIGRPSELQGTVVRAEYLPDTDTVLLTVGTHDEITSGVFHKLTGALTGQGLQIRSAEINTLSDRLVLDRFWVSDPDYTGESPPDRIKQITSALVQSLRESDDRPPSFRRTWTVGGRERPMDTDLPPRVNADNATSDRYTILDVFTHDRTGLLYAVTRALFQLELSVARAIIGTYRDQVVDVFYVTDRQGGKIEDEKRLEEIQRRLLEVLEGYSGDTY